MSIKKNEYYDGNKLKMGQDTRVKELIEAIRRFMYLGTIQSKLDLEKVIAKLEEKQ